MNDDVSQESTSLAACDTHSWNLTSVFAASVLLVLAGSIANLPVLDGKFLNFDDTDYVTNNPRVSGGLTFGNISWAVTTRHASNWHPLTWISHQADASVFGPKSTVGPHAVNLFLHLVCGVALFSFLLSATGRYWPSLVVGALFLLHPINVESVAWISQRKNLLSAFLFLLTLLAYLAYARAPSARRFLACLIAYAASLMAKPMMVTGPVLLLLLDAWPLGRLRHSGAARCVYEKIPFAILAALSCLLTLWAQQGAIASGNVLPLEVRIATALVSAAGYLGLLAWPVSLSPIYLHPRAVPGEGRLLISIAALLAISVAVYLARRRRYPITGWLWYLFALVPTLGFVQVGLQSMADRYAYVPFIGLYVLIAWALADVVTTHTAWRRAAAIVGLVAATVLGTLTFRQANVWRDSFRLFEHAIAVDPDNYVAHYHLADAYEKQWERSGDSGDLQSAALHAQAAYEAAWAAGYRNVRLPVHLATLWANTNRVPQAKRLLEEVIEERPDYAPAKAHLAEVMLVRGDRKRAEELARAALKLDPTNEVARRVLGQLRGPFGE